MKKFEHFKNDIRFGTCGGLTVDTPAGCVMISTDGSGYISRNPDVFTGGSDVSNSVVAEPSYRLSNVVPANADLSALLYETLSSALGKDTLCQGANVTADSFYSSQGRIDDAHFDDDNHNITQMLLNKYPTARSLEMESFWLLHLAHCSKVPIKATAAAIVVANRPTGEVMDGALLDDLEKKGGQAMLEAITRISL